MFSIIKQIIISLVAVCLLLACSPAKLPQIKQYHLTGTANKTFATTSHTDSVLVLKPSTVSGYDTQALIYSSRPFQLDAFAENQWIATPGEMLQPLIVESLLNTGYFAAVMGQPFTGKTRYLLKTTVLDIMQDFVHCPPVAKLAIKFDVLDQKQGSVIASKRFRQVIDMGHAGPYDGVVALNRANQLILDRLVGFVVRACQRAGAKA